MKRKNLKGFVAVLLTLLAGIILAGCASTPAETEAAGPVITPGPNESIVVIQRKKTMAGAAITMKVWVDDVETASAKNGQVISFAITDGDHVIQAGSSNVDKGEAVFISMQGERITLFAEPKMGAFAARFSLTQTGKYKL